MSRVPRDFTYDVGRGLAIVLVVFGHAERGLREAALAPPDPVLLFLDYAIYTFHMPFFFFVSGLFFKSPSDQDQQRFTHNLIKNIAIPYIAWSLVQGVVMVAMGNLGLTNGQLSVERLSSILWWPISPFWFLYSLFFSQIILYVWHECPKAAVVSMAASSFVIANWLGWSVVEDVSYGLFYFALGSRAQINAVRNRRFDSNWLLAGLAVFIVSTMVCWQAQIPERYAVLSAMSGTLVLVIASRKLAQSGSGAAKAFRTLGQLSMGIFLLHIMAIGASRAIAVKLIGAPDWISLLTIVTLFSVLAPAFVQWLAIHLKLDGYAALPASAFRNKSKPESFAASSRKG